MTSHGCRTHHRRRQPHHAPSASSTIADHSLTFSSIFHDSDTHIPKIPNRSVLPSITPIASPPPIFPRDPAQIDSHEHHAHHMGHPRVVRLMKTSPLPEIQPQRPAPSSTTSIAPATPDPAWPTFIHRIQIRRPAMPDTHDPCDAHQQHAHHRWHHTIPAHRKLAIYSSST
ncbi:hypothetical protein ACLOJK_036478 [Asimina triloba]